MNELLPPSASDEKVTIWQLIARQLAGEATESELAQLYDLLNEDTELKDAVQVLNAVWQKTELNGSDDKSTTLLIHQIRKRCISLEN